MASKTKISSKEQAKIKVVKQYTDFDFSFLAENFYDIDKPRFLSRVSLKERLSSGSIRYDWVTTEEIYYEKALRFLTRFGYGLFEYLSKEKLPNVNFRMNSDESFCSLTKNMIQVGINLLTQDNIPKQQKVDILTAITIHELYHKRFTLADIKKTISLRKYEHFYNNEKVSTAVEKLFPTKLQGLLNNILEDRRIERLGSEDFPGYSFFFEETRKYASFLHAEKKFVPTFVEAILLDYILIKILLPELEDKFLEQVDLYEAGLDEFTTKPEKAITADAIKLWKSQMKDIRSLIAKFKEHIENNTSTVFSDKWSDILMETNKLYDLFPKEMKERIEQKMKENEVIYINITCELGGVNKNEGNRIELTSEQMAELESIISDEIKKIEADKESEPGTTQVRRVEEQKVRATDQHNNFYKIVQIIEEPLQGIDQSLFNDAKKAARNICNNLGFLDSKFNRFIENYELTEGELDEDELYSIGFGNKNLFESIEDIPGYSLDFGILLDESGSMSGRIREAKLAVLSLLLGLKGNKHINLFVYGHTANEGDSSRDSFQMYKYYNSLERSMDWRRIFSAKSRSNNADGYAIDKMGDIMKQSKCKDKILCVVSDGQPAAAGYGGSQGEAHVKTVTTRLENEGILVIQLCMAYIENSPRMFKHFIQYEKDGRFFDNLKKVLLTKLHQFSDQV